MKMKKFVSLALCVVMMMSLLVTTAFAKGEENLSLSVPGDVEAVVGETIVVKVNNTDLVSDSIAFHFTFDNAALECVSIEGTQDVAGVYLVPEVGYPKEATAVSTVPEANASGVVGFGWAGSDDVNYKAGTIAVVTFKVVAEPAGDLVFALFGDDGLQVNGGNSNATVQKPAVTPPPTYYTVTLHANNGSGATEEYDYVAGTTFTAPSGCDFTAPSGKTFKGWYTAATGGTKVTSFQVTEDVDIYAQWKPASGGGYYEPDVESPKTFDAGAVVYIGVTLLAAAGSAVVLKKKD